MGNKLGMAFKSFPIKAEHLKGSTYGAFKAWEWNDVKRPFWKCWKVTQLIKLVCEGNKQSVWVSGIICQEMTVCRWYLKWAGANLTNVSLEAFTCADL